MKRRGALLGGLALAIAAAVRRASAGTGSKEEGSTDPCSAPPSYADPAPLGVGVESARALAGGYGEGQYFIDVEQGWTLTHDSLLAHRIGAPLAGVIDDRSRPHGTAVLGIVCGSNPGGYSGLAPRVASVHVSSTSASLRSGIAAAIDKLVALGAAQREGGGGVLLLETQARLMTPQGGMGHLPAEALPQLFDLIASATRRGITVIEAAGNGRDTGSVSQGIDLDEFKDESGEAFLRRDSSRGDSGAIIVGAARAAVVGGRHQRITSSNFGSRIDCYAWGELVTAPASTSRAPFAHSGCVADFGETSAAAAIVAGVALIVQGVVAAARPGLRMPPLQLREILSHRDLGTACAGSKGTIGVMPDLARILDASVLGITPVRRAKRSQAGESG
ncbi:MAG TPA: S8 family serine peptidase [Steroidobacteraceae bacterium]|nr:S8 family serine peptidase [Steroidobacteraceae bacterium]